MKKELIESIKVGIRNTPNDGKPIEVVLTASDALNKALGINGLPKGKISEFFGPEKLAKKALVVDTIAKIQKKDGIVALVTSNDLPEEFVKTSGVDLNNLILSQPDEIIQGLEIVDTLAHTGAIDLIVLDLPMISASLDEVKGITEALSKIKLTLEKTSTPLLIITNSKNESLFIEAPANPVTQKLQFVSAVRVDFRNIESEGEDVTAKFKVIKSYAALPYKTGEIKVNTSKGLISDIEAESEGVR